MATRPTAKRGAKPGRTPGATPSTALLSNAVAPPFKRNPPPAPKAPVAPEAGDGPPTRLDPGTPPDRPKPAMLPYVAETEMATGGGNGSGGLHGTSVLSPDRIERYRRSRFNPFIGLTPERLVQYLSDWNAGYLRYLAILMDMVLQRDWTYKTVAPKRWGDASRERFQIQLVEGHEKDPEALAQKEALTYFYSNLKVTSAVEADQIGGVPLLCRQMVRYGIGLKYCVHEILWRQTPNGLSAVLNHVPPWFFESRTGKLRFLMEDFAWDGVPMLTAQPTVQGGKLDIASWMVSVGEGLMEAGVILNMYKMWALRDWADYSEARGKPLLIGNTKAPFNSDKWQNFRDALRELNPNNPMLMGPIEEDKVEILNTAAQGAFAPQLQFEAMEKAQITLWRGSDLGTNSSGQNQEGTGASLQGGETNVLKDDDTQWISENCNLQLDPLVIRITRGPGVPVLAYFSLGGAKKASALDLQVYTGLVGLGLDVAKETAHEVFSIPQPSPGAELLKQPAPPSPFGGGGGFGGKGEVDEDGNPVPPDGADDGTGADDAEEGDGSGLPDRLQRPDFGNEGAGHEFHGNQWAPAHTMSADERSAEVARLKEHHKAALAAPLMSEGSISPMQVGMFSDRQKAKWQDNATEKMAVEARIRELSKPDEQLKVEDRTRRMSKAKNEKTQILSFHQTVSGLGRMAHKADGTLKPSYKRVVDANANRLAEIHTEFPELAETANEAANARPVVRPLIASALARIGAAQKRSLAPVAARLQALAREPDDGRLLAGLRALRKDVPALLRAANKAPAAAGAWADAIGTALVAGAARKHALVGNEGTTIGAIRGWVTRRQDGVREWPLMRDHAAGADAAAATGAKHLQSSEANTYEGGRVTVHRLEHADPVAAGMRLDSYLRKNGHAVNWSQDLNGGTHLIANPVVTGRGAHHFVLTRPALTSAGDTANEASYLEAVAGYMANDGGVACGGAYIPADRVCHIGSAVPGPQAPKPAAFATDQSREAHAATTKAWASGTFQDHKAAAEAHEAAMRAREGAGDKDGAAMHKGLADTHRSAATKAALAMFLHKKVANERANDAAADALRQQVADALGLDVDDPDLEAKAQRAYENMTAQEGDDDEQDGDGTGAGGETAAPKGPGAGPRGAGTAAPAGGAGGPGTGEGDDAGSVAAAAGGVAPQPTAADAPANHKPPPAPKGPPPELLDFTEFQASGWSDPAALGLAVANTGQLGAQHKAYIAEAVKARKPVLKRTTDYYGVQVPLGYVAKDDRYVWDPKAAGASGDGAEGQPEPSADGNKAPGQRAAANEAADQPRDERGRWVLFHGNTPSFGQFASTPLGIHFGSRKAAQDRLEQTGQRQGQIRKYAVDVKNPVQLRYDPGEWKPHEVLDALPKDVQAKVEESFPYDISDLDHEDLKGELEKLGYDGIRYKNAFEGGGDSLLAFSKEQAEELGNESRTIQGGTEPGFSGSSDQLGAAQDSRVGTTAKLLATRDQDAAEPFEHQSPASADSGAHGSEPNDGDGDAAPVKPGRTPELMTPDEFKASAYGSVATLGLEVAMPWHMHSAHRAYVEDALKSRKPVLKAAMDTFGRDGLRLPDGYRDDGNGVYVWSKDVAPSVPPRVWAQ